MRNTARVRPCFRFGVQVRTDLREGQQRLSLTEWNGMEVNSRYEYSEIFYSTDRGNELNLKQEIELVGGRKSRPFVLLPC